MLVYSMYTSVLALYVKGLYFLINYIGPIHKDGSIYQGIT